jgi:exodeoxyribonuclease-5
MAIDKTKLLGDQPQAYDYLRKFYASSEMVMVLNGYAGTGKTYLVSNMVKSIAAKSKDYILLAAPTNKAAKVLGKTIGAVPPHVHIRTIHSALGLVVDEKNDKNELVGEKEVKFCEYKLVIIDECSMITDEVFQHINNQRVKTQKVIYTGDRLQLPPVQTLTKEQKAKRNGVEESLSFSNKFQVEMSQIVRQGEGHPVIELGAKIRKDINLSRDVIFDAKPSINSNGEGVYKMSKGKVLDHYVRLFKSEEADVKLVAFTNKSVDEWNRSIREAIHGKNLPTYLQNESIVLHAPYHSFHNGDEFKIETITEPHTFKAETLEIECVFINELTHKIRVPLNIVKFRNLMQKLVREKKWQLYFDLKERIATVSHTYASTVHKSQGSTLTHIFVDVVNIRYAKEARMLNQLLYVAVTRPTRLAYLIV